MKDKLKFLTKQSLKKKIDTKWFKGVNILLLVLLLFLANMDRVVTFFGGDFEGEKNIYVLDEVNGFDFFSNAFLASSKSLEEINNYKVLKSSLSLESLKKTLEENKEDIIVSLSFDETNFMKAEIISFDEVNMMTKQLLFSSLNSLKETIAFQNSGLTEDEILSLKTPVSVTSTYLNSEVQGENQELIASLAILVIILPCFFLIIMLVQMIGAEVNDEKTTRSMEIIISNVSPKTHFLSKIYASTLFVLIQGALLLFYGFLAFLVRSVFAGGSESLMLTGSVGEILQVVRDSGIINILLQGLPFILLLFVFSFISYAILAGVLASMTTSIEDFQQLQTPIMLIIVVGYYLAIMASQFEGAFFIKAVSYIPMLSFLLSPVLYTLGQITIIELGISTLITGIFTFVLFRYGLRIYKVGILNYSSTKLWKKMFRSLKRK